MLCFTFTFKQYRNRCCVDDQYVFMGEVSLHVFGIGLASAMHGVEAVAIGGSE
jgi:hypothetical protein